MLHAVQGAYVEQAGNKLIRDIQKVLMPYSPYRYEQSDALGYADLTATSTPRSRDPYRLVFFKLNLDSNSRKEN